MELDAGPRQQAFLLAVLLAAAGRPVSRGELIESIWGEDAPESVVNVIHKYVGALRHLLEPDLPARGSGSYLLRHGEGYLCAAGPDVLDLARFRQLATAAREERDRPEESLDHWIAALGLWRGRAGEGLPRGPAAEALFAALDDEFRDACTAAADLALAVGRSTSVVAPLRLAAATAPWDEPVHAALVTALGAAGRQAEALAVSRAVRARLAEDLGVDPGPLLDDAQRRVLAQETPAGAGAPPPRRRSPAEEAPSGRQGSLVGRAEELAVVRATLRRAAAGDGAHVVVEGEPGVGKTRLLVELAADAAQRGALVVWGRGLDDRGAPTMWPWVQVLHGLVDALPARERESWLAGELGKLVAPGDGAVPDQVLPERRAQFRLFERVVALLGAVAARRAVVLILDDLQWADEASLQLVGHLVTRLPAGVALVGALRDRAPVPDAGLAAALAAASRVPGHRRVRLGPLGASEVAELVHREIGQDLAPGVAHHVYARTAGNPFFVLELSRLLADGGAVTDEAAARVGVPATVRDVVRSRIEGLDESTVRLLQVAALLGRDVRLRVLADVADVEVPRCLDLLGAAEALGIIAPAPEDPSSYRFAHDLVRESVSETTPPRRATRLHRRAADVLERLDTDESTPERVAAHLWAAGPMAGPARTASALIRAGRRAATKSALEAAERSLRAAAQVARSAGLRELELTALAQLTAVAGMRSMYGAALRVLERAEHLARGLGREAEAAGFLYSRWAAHVQALDLDHSTPLARRLLAYGEASDDPIVRAYGLEAWGIEEWDAGRIGEAYRYQSRAVRLLERSRRGGEDPVRRDLELLMTGLLAETTALHGDLGGAQVLLDRLEAIGDDRYAVTVRATIGTRIAAIAGDPETALRDAERGIAVDPEFSYVFLGTYQRLARCWAHALTGHDPVRHTTEARRLVETNLRDPVRSCVATWYGFIGEMCLAASDPDAAAAALDLADHFLATSRQRYAAALLVLLRARVLRARGAAHATVVATAEEGRALALEQEAHLVVHRADALLGELRSDSVRH
ncbi:BTAD domain-containing putative transcriptional regulator [Actinomycetospora straminea]|uniref:BTAD domain-containing putative transcriptional regulator n=1 Tax=Actinomycetospora straminea TaxID=663607 RepID=UPI0023665549|nr:BTAD domain-containing putative transcriptional regulator [Actinomycetospora straminea]MDD7933844.1 BTAD domain-containing putative transcriptional regulator [Actinomycetospora straminea]